MEQEAFFVFVFWQPNTKEIREPYRVISDANVTVKRAAMQKGVGLTETSKRVQIDFDPLGKQLCYLVAAYFSMTDHEITYKGIIRPVAVVETEEEAAAIKEELEKGNAKKFVKDKREKFDHALVHPLLISPS